MTDKTTLDAQSVTITALEYANSRENVVVRFASQGVPAGLDVALLDETELPFDLDLVEGYVDDSGEFTATNLDRGNGWRFRDWNRNDVYALWLREDAEEWQTQNDEYEAS